MTWPRPRFTVRWLMAAVAALGVLLATLAIRRSQFLELASHHRDQIARIRDRTGGALDFFGPDAQWVLWHSRLERKYERLARYPWLPVAPDPPAPE